MPFAPVNHTMLYYETFGTPISNQPPVVLIHGSTQTGQSCWGTVAPLLARTHYIIVPDCRGHGRSANPNATYSFKELAADTAGLIRALGFERAHLVGHSNGGNVVLVTLLEHPEVIQTCIPMAANAWVSPDLPEKEPGLFDPERVERDDPNWMTEMIALHDPFQGAGYWRTLLKLTVDELITEPNYTPEDLARVQRPVLVIQGANDRVNAPFKHAEFIARHIPSAEQWIPEGIAHSVHEEALFAWVDTVLGFIARRGDFVSDALFRLKKEICPDERLSVFDLSWRGGVLQGNVLHASQRQAARLAVGQIMGCMLNEVEDRVRVLLDDSTPWALLARSVEDLRKQAAISTERVSQVRMGEAVRVLDTKGDWSFVQVVRDGYIGWLHTRSLHICTQAGVEAYQAECSVRIRAALTEAFASPSSQEVIGRIPFAVRLPGGAVEQGRQALTLPDGQTWWAAVEDLAPTAPAAGSASEQIMAALGLIQRFVGVPYLWGGRTPFGFDCSGLASTFWGWLGVQIPRDADMQFASLPAVQGALQPGDLLFFGEEQEVLHGQWEFHISHVAISLGGDEFIHSNGTHWGVGFNSFAEDSPFFRAWLKENYRGARRPVWS